MKKYKFLKNFPKYNPNEKINSIIIGKTRITVIKIITLKSNLFNLEDIFYFR